MPAIYFARLKGAQVDIAKHLLLDEMAKDPSKLLFDAAAYKSFRDQRFEKIWEIAARIVNSEVTGAAR